MSEKRVRFIMPIVLIIAIGAVSTASIFIRFAQQNAPSLTIAALRMTIATGVLAPLALGRYRDDLRKLTRNEFIFGALSGIFLAAHFATWISSLEYTSVASSVVIVSTGPLWVALLSPIFLKEHLSPTAIVGLCLAIAGGGVIGLSDACQWENHLICTDLQEILRGRAIWGNFLALAGAWAVTGYLIIGRKLRTRVGLIPYIFLVYGVAAIVLLISMYASGQTPTGYPMDTYLWIFLLAAIPQLIGHTTYNWALRYLPATFVAITTLGEPIGSAILAFFILLESPTTIILAGGVLILAGIYLGSKQNK